MFGWILRKIDNIRIAVSYIGYETKCRRDWLLNAQRLFSTEQLEREIDRRMVEPQQYAFQTYSIPINVIEEDRSRIANTVNDAKSKLAILNCDYAADLSVLYERKDCLYAERKICSDNLSSAYDDLESAKASLASWYSRAEGNWLGNGGKKLPKHAFFGQDISDRDCYKSRRDSAAYSVGCYKSERSSVDRQINETKADIASIKASRQIMIDLKKAGFDKRIVNSTIENGTRQLNALSNKLSALNSERQKYLDQVRITTGINKLDAEITSLKTQYAQRMKEFDNESQKLDRKTRHRQQWLTEHARH